MNRYAVMVVVVDSTGETSTITGFYEHTADQLPSLSEEIDVMDTVGRTFRVRVTHTTRRDREPP